MGLAFGLLRLSPDAFWAMTPIEFNAALQALGFSKTGSLSREELARLMRLFPDNPENANGR